MHRVWLPKLALLAVCVATPSAAIPSVLNQPKTLGRTPWPSSFSQSPTVSGPLDKRSQPAKFDLNKDGSSFLWVLQENYEGKTFFDGFEFFAFSDPTHGHVNYVNQEDAFQKNLAYVTNDNKVIMKGDNTTRLAPGEYRDSVRVSSKSRFTTGLFILDLNKAPWGCAVWPAFWTVGPNWPNDGEIDIIEGVHDNEHNQVTWHTGPGCLLNTTANFTGTVVSQQSLDCDGTLPGNPGCGITEWSRASYGPYFDAQGGGVFAMKWDENGIAVWSFYRAAVPQDIVKGEPNPLLWGTPSAVLDPSQCDPLKFFVKHAIVFDITFCGDWAGNSYATTTCPGTCVERLVEPANFDNATWIINSLKVYRKQGVSGSIFSGATERQGDRLPLFVGLGSAVIAVLVGLGV